MNEEIVRMLQDPHIMPLLLSAGTYPSDNCLNEKPEISITVNKLFTSLDNFLFNLDVG